MKGNDFFLNNLPSLSLDLSSMSILLGRLAFASLLVSMFSYWFQATYEKKTFLGKLPFFTMWLANVTLALILGIRWIDSGHFPLSNLYESLLFLSWSLTGIHLFLEHALNSGVAKQGTLLNLGAITSPLSLFTNAFATFSLPQEMQKATVLVPALQSNWLVMHVTVMIVSYAALLSGSLLAIAFLVIKLLIADKNQIEDPIPTNLALNQSNSATFLTNRKAENLHNTKLFLELPPLVPNITNTVNYTIEESNERTTFFPETGVRSVSETGKEMGQNGTKTSLLTTLDNLSYRSIGLGFALLTIGILSGAVWANETWGSYWSWDPKETWAFITWLIFALYLHTRLSKGWVGKESAFVATFGFATIWFCYLGVNLFGKGLHSYGWFQTLHVL